MKNSLTIIIWWAYLLRKREKRISMNIYDIAREAGVSISTVSRVLNDKGNVNENTRKNVMEILQKHNYTPSAIARGMVSKSMRTSRRGYEVTLCNTGGELPETEKYLRTAVEKKADGLVLVGSIFNTLCRTPEIEALLRTTPLVLANGRLDLPNSYSVLVDDQYGVSLAVRHLAEKGHKEIYYLKDMNTASAELKCQGFLNGMRQEGLEAAKRRVLETEMSLAGGMRAVEKLLHSQRPFTALVCGEDITAAGAVKALLRAGLRVPEDVAVTGYNNSEYARICEPQLTTIDNKPELVAMLSVQLLTSLIEKTDAYSSCTIQPELVQGQTT